MTTIRDDVSGIVRRHIAGEAGGNAHWYQADAAPAHDADLRRARKENLYPSVTTVLKVWPKYMLEAYKIERAINSALTLKRKKGEAQEDFRKRIIEDSKSEAGAAANTGKALHQMINIRLTTGKWPEGEAWAPWKPWMDSYEAWIAANIIGVTVSEEAFVSHVLGFGGTIDLIADTKQWGHALLDMKNQAVTTKGKPAFYPEFLMQMVAYQEMAPSMPEALVTLVLNREAPDLPYIKVYPPETWQDAWDDFAAALELWRRVNRYDPRPLATVDESMA